jgi:hypothetical protein
LGNETPGLPHQRSPQWLGGIGHIRGEQLFRPSLLGLVDLVDIDGLLSSASAEGLLVPRVGGQNSLSQQRRQRFQAWKKTVLPLF